MTHAFGEHAPRPLDTRPRHTQSTVAFEIRLTLASLELLTAAQNVLNYWNSDGSMCDGPTKYDRLQDAANEYRAAFTNLPKGMNDYPLNKGEPT
jgi:hypothetical protein